jgi:hypothetical protein
VPHRQSIPLHAAAHPASPACSKGSAQRAEQVWQRQALTWCLQMDALCDFQPAFYTSKYTEFTPEPCVPCLTRCAGDLAFNIALGATLVAIPLSIGAAARAAFVKYKFTDKRVSVKTEAPWESESTTVRCLLPSSLAVCRPAAQPHTLLCCTCERMDKLAGCKVHICVCRPPYALLLPSWPPWIGPCCWK